MNENRTFTALRDNGKFVAAARALYGEGKTEYEAERYARLYRVHSEKYGHGEFYSSPGRIEVLGNHTDHNNGKVLCASITVDTLACVTPSDERRIVVESEGYPVVDVRLDNLYPDKNERGRTDALVRGVCAYLFENGYKVGGFRATTVSDVFKGAGVSSSACFEVLVCEILSDLYNGGAIDALTKARASHYAESIYFGKPCGLLDQSAIALGGVSFIDFKMPKKPEVEHVDWTFDNLDIVLTNTGGDHCDLTGQYADIRYEMELVARVFGRRKLRSVSSKAFYEALPEVQEKVSGRAILRAMHFYEENKRVDLGVRALKRKELKHFCAAINDSGASSAMLLQNVAPAGDNKQRIPLAVALSKKCAGVKAARVHGGGFAGTVIAYVDKRASAAYAATMKRIFGEENVYTVGVRDRGTCKVEL